MTAHIYTKSFNNLTTAFTKRFQCRHPVINAPMGGIAGAELAAAAARAGCIGLVGTGSQDANTKIKFKSVGAISQVYRDAVSLAGPQGNQIGVGFVVKNQLEKDPVLLCQIECLKPSYIWLSGGDYNSQERVDFTPYCKIVKTARYPATLFVQVNTVEQAISAAHFGADVVILQGKEAGGHQYGRSSDTNEGPSEHPLGTINLIRETRKALAGHCHQPLLAGAGGIVSGAHFVSVLEAGADAAVIGTLLAPTVESLLPPQTKQELLRVSSTKGGIYITNPDGTVVGMHGSKYELPEDVQKMHQVPQWDVDGPSTEIPREKPHPLVAAELELSDSEDEGAASKRIRPAEEVLRDLMEDTLQQMEVACAGAAPSAESDAEFGTSLEGGDEPGTGTGTGTGPDGPRAFMKEPEAPEEVEELEFGETERKQDFKSWVDGQPDTENPVETPQETKKKNKDKVRETFGDPHFGFW